MTIIRLKEMNNEQDDLFPQHPIYLFLDTGFVEKIDLLWLRKNIHIVAVINSDKKIIHNNTCTKEELDFIISIQEKNIKNFRGLLVILTGGLPYYSTLISLVRRLALLNYCSNLDMENCDKFEIIKVSEKKNEFILLAAFKTKEVEK